MSSRQFMITTDLCTPICVYVCVCEEKKSSSGSQRHTKLTQAVSLQSLTVNACRHHAALPLSLSLRHRNEVVHVQGFLRQGSRRQLRSQDGMLLWR